MELTTTKTLPRKMSAGSQAQRLTRDIIRRAFDSIQLPCDTKRTSRATVGEEALFSS